MNIASGLGKSTDYGENKIEVKESNIGRRRGLVKGNLNSQSSASFMRFATPSKYNRIHHNLDSSYSQMNYLQKSQQLRRSSSRGNRLFTSTLSRNLTPMRTNFSRNFNHTPMHQRSGSLTRNDSLLSIHALNNPMKSQVQFHKARVKKLRLSNVNSATSSQLRAFNVYSPYCTFSNYKPQFKVLAAEGLSIETFEKEEEVNSDMSVVAKSLLQMCKCVKESLAYLKTNDIGRAKFSVISREWEFAEMDFEKHSAKLKDEHGVELFDDKKLEEFKMAKTDKGEHETLASVRSTVQKVLGNSDPFEGVSELLNTTGA